MFKTTKIAIATLAILYMVDVCHNYNGCGPGKFDINDGLRLVGEESLIECCNR